MKILKLTLKKEWFGMVLSGEKNEEYRELKMYWAVRLMNGFPKEFGIETLNPDFKHFDAVEFTNGYSKKSPTVTKECLGIDIGVGLYVLGAPNVPVFRIKLGKEVSRLNC